MFKISHLVIIFSGCLLMVAIAGAFIPKKVMFWGAEEKKTPGKALVTYGIAAVICFAGGFGLGEYASEQQKLLPPAITSTAQTTPTPVPAPAPTPIPKETPKPQQSVKIVEGWKWSQDDTGFDYVRGSVQNVGNRPIGYMEIHAEYKDKNGKVVDTAYTNIGEVIKPGNQKKFEIMHKSDVNEKEVRIYTKDVRYN